MVVAADLNREADEARSAGRSARAGSKRVYLAWSVILLVIVGSILFATFDGQSNLSFSQRVAGLEAQFKCPSCIDLSVADSTSASSQSIKNFIKTEVSQGKTDQEIRNSLVGSYGISILFTPPTSGVSGLIWILPVALLGGASLALFARSRGSTLSRGRPLSEADDPADLAMPASVEASRSPLIGRDSKLMRTIVSRRRLLRLGGVTLVVLASLVYYFAAIRPSQSTAATVAVADAELSQAVNLTLIGQDVQALKLFSAVLHKDPIQVQALSYEGWLLFQAGERAKSKALIVKGRSLVLEATQLAPNYPDAHGFLALIEIYDGNNRTQAAVEFKHFLADGASPQLKLALTGAYRKALAAS